MSSAEQAYQSYDKPRWAPPSWVFSWVWAILYLIIIISFGFLFYEASQDNIPASVYVPFLLNIILNVLYFPVQFWLKQPLLAAIIILGMIGTLIWGFTALMIETPEYSWVFYANLPYMLWICFAAILQFAIVLKN